MGWPVWRSSERNWRELKIATADRRTSSELNLPARRTRANPAPIHHRRRGKSGEEPLIEQSDRSRRAGFHLGSTKEMHERHSFVGSNTTAYLLERRHANIMRSFEDLAVFLRLRGDSSLETTGTSANAIIRSECSIVFGEKPPGNLGGRQGKTSHRRLCRHF